MAQDVPAFFGFFWGGREGWRQPLISSGVAKGSCRATLRGQPLHDVRRARLSRPVRRRRTRCRGSSGYRITVKHEPGGDVGGYLHSRVAEGDALEVAAPRGDFTLADASSTVALISAGIGVTPVLAMLHTLAETGAHRGV